MTARRDTRTTPTDEQDDHPGNIVASLFQPADADQTPDTPNDGPDIDLDLDPADTDDQGTSPDAEQQDTEQQDTDDDQGDAELPPAAKAAREAAARRHQLRDAQDQIKQRDEQLAERDQQLAARDETIAGLRRQFAQETVGTLLPKPEALWIDGFTVDQVLDDDGNIDQAKLLERVEQLRTEYGVQQPAPVVPRARPVPIRDAGGVQPFTAQDRFAQAFTARRPR